MKKSLLFGTLCAAIISIVALPIHAALIDFEGASGVAPIGEFLDVGDYRFTLTGGGSGVLVIITSSNIIEADTTKLFATNHSEITMTRIDGGAFNLLSLDISGSWVDPEDWRRWADSVDIIAGASTTNVVLDGTPATYQNIVLNYLDVTNVQFDPIINDNLAANSYEFVIDNLSVSAVPVPTAVWLFGSGLLVLIGIARRKAA